MKYILTFLVCCILAGVLIGYLTEDFNKEQKTKKENREKAYEISKKIEALGNELEYESARPRFQIGNLEESIRIEQLNPNAEERKRKTDSIYKAVEDWETNLDRIVDDIKRLNNSYKSLSGKKLVPNL